MLLTALTVTCVWWVLHAVLCDTTPRVFGRHFGGWLTVRQDTTCVGETYQSGGVSMPWVSDICLRACAVYFGGRGSIVPPVRCVAWASAT